MSAQSDVAAVVLMAIGDGISWRRAVDPGFKADTVLPLILHMIHGLLTRPVEQTSMQP